MEFSDKIQEGVRCLLDSGHTDIARWMLEKLIADVPDSAQAHHELALIAHEQGDTQYAGHLLKKAVEYAPHNSCFQKSLADYYYVTEQQPEAAIEQYQKVVSLNPEDTETLMTVAHLHVALHRFDEAAGFYQRALAVDPSLQEAREILAKLTAHQDKRDRQQVAQVSPDELYETACNQIAQGQTQDAVKTLEKILSIDSNHALAHNDLAVLCFESGDLDAARMHYEKAAEIAPDNLTFQKNLGDFYYLQCSEIENALTRYVQALRLDPQDVETLIATGHVCMTLNQMEDARVFFERVLDVEPWNSDAGNLLQQIDQRAITPVKQPVERDLYETAVGKANAGDPHGAIQDLQQLISKEPSHGPAYNDLGVLHYDLGNKSEALRFYEQAARLEPDNATFLKNLADFYFVEQGRAEDALRLYIRILEMDREDVDCLLAAGTICANVNQNDDARTFFERVLEIEPWNDKARSALDKIFQSAGSGNTIDFIKKMA